MSEQNLELYKKYRPRTWEQVVGQKSVVESLRNTVLNGAENCPTGFLFAGGPGSGKTTCALILAKALNCENPTDNGNPCNECDTCKSIDSMTNPGIQYFSMANDGSADFVRKMVNDAKIKQPVNKQIIIADEVQNLSNQAFDALLIPLESEKMKTTFIFCTTEPEKVRSAVLSRLQVRNFTPVDNKTLGNHLVNISKQEGWINDDGKNKVNIDDLKAILDISGGSVRNAIGNLDTFIQTGTINTGSSQEILNSILNKKPIELYNISNKMLENGESYIKTMEKIYRILLNALIKKASGEKLNNIENQIIKTMNPNIILWALDTIGEGLKSMSSKVIDYKILFETTMMKILLKISKK